MAFKITKINGQPNSVDTKEYICQSENDIKKLPRYGIRGTQEEKNDTVSNNPCAIGSTAIVCGANVSTKVYILAPDNEWVEL